MCIRDSLMRDFVNPYSSPTGEIYSPSNVLNNVDFPEFGFPIIPILILLKFINIGVFVRQIN